MKKTNILKYTLFILLFSVFFVACKDDESCAESTWYTDADADGLGNPDVSILACEQPEGYVANMDDKIDQVMTRQATPMLFKSTGERCGPCGGWGWEAYGDIIYKYKGGKAFTWANYGSSFSSGSFRGQEMNETRSTMEEIQSSFSQNASKPSFIVNNEVFSSFEGPVNAMKAADAFFLTQAPVGIVMSTHLEGNTLTIHAEAEVFANLDDGAYVMGAYLIEDKAVGPQDGDIGVNGDVQHHNVMRGSLSETPWGEELSADGLIEGSVYERTYTIEVPESYNKENFSYGVILWSRRISTYKFVNACTTQ